MLNKLVVMQRATNAHSLMVNTHSSKKQSLALLGGVEPQCNDSDFEHLISDFLWRKKSICH